MTELIICCTITAAICSLVAFFAGCIVCTVMYRDEIKSLALQVSQLRELNRRYQDENPHWYVKRVIERN